MTSPKAPQGSFPCPHCGKMVQPSEALIHQFALPYLETREAEVREATEAAVRRYYERELEEERLKSGQLKETVGEQQQKIREQQDQEAKLRRAQRALERKTEDLELERERIYDEARAEVRPEEEARAKKRVDAERLRMASEQKEQQRRRDEAHEEELRRRDVTIHKLEEESKQLQDKLKEAHRTSSSGTRLLEGVPAQEVFAEALRKRWPGDLITVAPKGKAGADVVQVVRIGTAEIGMILWECKGVAQWRGEWLRKLDGDARVAGADRAVIVSEVLPKDTEPSTQIDGIWVTNYGHACDLAAGLREVIITDHLNRQANAAKDDRGGIVCDYIYGGGLGSRANKHEHLLDLMESTHEQEKRVTLKRWRQQEDYIAALRAHGVRAIASDILRLTGETPGDVHDELDQKDHNPPELEEGDDPPQLPAA